MTALAIATVLILGFGIGTAFGIWAGHAIDDAASTHPLDGPDGPIITNGNLE